MRNFLLAMGLMVLASAGALKPAFEPLIIPFCVALCALWHPTA